MSELTRDLFNTFEDQYGNQIITFFDDKYLNRRKELA